MLIEVSNPRARARLGCGFSGEDGLADEGEVASEGPRAQEV